MPSMDVPLMSPIARKVSPMLVSWLLEHLADQPRPIPLLRMRGRTHARQTAPRPEDISRRSPGSAVDPAASQPRHGACCRPILARTIDGASTLAHPRSLSEGERAPGKSGPLPIPQPVPHFDPSCRASSAQSRRPGLSLWAVSCPGKPSCALSTLAVGSKPVAAACRQSDNHPWGRRALRGALLSLAKEGQRRDSRAGRGCGNLGLCGPP